MKKLSLDKKTTNSLFMKLRMQGRLQSPFILMCNFLAVWGEFLDVLFLNALVVSTIPPKSPHAQLVLLAAIF